MLAIKRTHINTILNQEQISQLPLHLWNRIEDILERTVSILIYYMRRDNKLIKLVDVSNNTILKEIIIDNCYDECIKLSSDGTFLTYIDVMNNIVYYNINNTSINSINISNSTIFPKYFYFDRNGIYYVISSNNQIMIFDIKKKALKNIITSNSQEECTMNIISEDYKKLLCRSNNYMKVYDFNNGNKLFSIQLNHLETGGISLYGNHIFYKQNNNIIIINDRLEYNYINDTEDELILNGIAFHPNNYIIALYLEMNIIIIDMIKKTVIKNIENMMFYENERYNNDDSYYNMEFTKDGNYLIIKYTDCIIKKIDL